MPARAQLFNTIDTSKAAVGLSTVNLATNQTFSDNEIKERFSLVYAVRTRIS